MSMQLAELGVRVAIPSTTLTQLEENEKALDFYATALDSVIKRPLEEWLRVPNSMISTIKKLSDWYDFLNKAQADLTLFLTQVEIWNNPVLVTRANVSSPTDAFNFSSN